MKKFMRVISLMLVVAAMMLCFAGCGEETVSNDGLTVINVWTGDTGSKTMYEQAVQEFNDTIGKENGMKIVYEAKEGLGETMPVALQTGQEPELFMSGSVAEYSEQGYIVALDDIKGGPELIEQYKDYLIKDKQIYKGKTYSLPYASNTYGLIYNKDMFKEAGIVDENGEAKPPKTLAEMREYAKILTDAKSGKYGFVIPLAWSGYFDTDIGNLVMANSGRGGYDYKTGKYDHSSYKAVLETIMGIKADKSLMPGSEGLDNDPARSRFAEGNIGMKLAVSWDVGVLNDQFPAKCDWGVARLPVADLDNAYYQNFALNTGYKISANAIERVGEEKLMIAYKYLVGKQMQKRIFELGGALPIDASYIGDLDSIDDSKYPKGWVDFAKLIKVSKAELNFAMPVDISGSVDLKTDFTNNVWPGKKSIDKAIADADKIMADGVAKYKSIHPDMNADEYIVPDHNRRIEG